MHDHVDTRDGQPRPVSLLDDLAATAPVAATAEMPADLAAMLNPEKGVFIRAKNKPVLDLAVEPVPGASGLWRVVNRTKGQPLLTEIPGVDCGGSHDGRRPRRAARARGALHRGLSPAMGC